MRIRRNALVYHENYLYHPYPMELELGQANQPFPPLRCTGVCVCVCVRERDDNGKWKNNRMASMATSRLSFVPTSPFLHWSTHLIPRRVALTTTKTMSPVLTCASQSPRLFEAAKYVVDNYVKSGMVVGLGSGDASSMAIQHMGRLLQAGNLKNIVGIPMSISSASEAAKAGIPLDNNQQNIEIDFAFNDANAVEEESLAAVIGQRKLEGGESILQEKNIVKVAKNLVFIVSENQCIRSYEGSIPVVIKMVNWLDTAEEIDDLFLGDAEVWRRASFGPADPLGGDFPLVTNEGHHILDLIFTSPIQDLCQVAKSLDQVDGVVDHGLVVDISCTMVIALQDGLQIVDNISTNVVKGK